MTSWKTAFPTKYVSKEDVGDKSLRLKISHVTFESDVDDQPVCYFNRCTKGLVCNKTNCEIISDLAGTEDVEKWAGTDVELYVDPNVMYSGKRVGGVRVRSCPPVAPAQPVQAEVVRESIPTSDLPF